MDCARSYSVTSHLASQKLTAYTHAHTQSPHARTNTINTAVRTTTKSGAPTRTHTHERTNERATHARSFPEIHTARSTHAPRLFLAHQPSDKLLVVDGAVAGPRGVSTILATFARSVFARGWLLDNLHVCLPSSARLTLFHPHSFYMGM